MKKITTISALILFLFAIVTSCEKNCDNEISNCRITSPQNGEEIALGETVIISVDDNSASNSILEVRFFIDGIGKTSLTNWPYNWEWQTASENLGNHTIFVKSFYQGGGSCTDEITVVLTDGVIGSDKPVADFTANPISGESPLQVTFNDKSHNAPDSWTWNFGDGNGSQEQNPSHTYTTDGLYTVSLIVSNMYGSDTLIRSNYINVGSIVMGEPCPGIPTITDADGNEYNTVLIGEQCWMKENLRIGQMVLGGSNQTNNGVIEKYCFDDNPENCLTYGGLYQWDEVMNYSNTEGTQGICPVGWHIPSDQDWKILEMHLGMSQVDADKPDWRGEAEGGKMKTTYGWADNGNGNNTSGFSGLPGGFRGAETGGYGSVTENGYWWSSTQFNDVQIWYRQLGKYVDMVNRTYNYKGSGISVRCVKD